MHVSRVATFALALLAPVALGACASHEKTEADHHEGGHHAMKAPDGLTPTARSASYPLTTCLVTGETLGAHAVAFMYQGREVQFCCPGCANGFAKAPEKFLAALPK